jgi:hypothetical protein
MKVLDCAISLCHKAFDKDAIRGKDSVGNRIALFDIDFAQYGVTQARTKRKPLKDDQICLSLMNYLGSHCLPTIRLKLDQERIQSVVSNLAQNIIAPALRNKDCSKSQFSPCVYRILVSILPISTGIKFWKREAWTFFMEQQFFQITPPSLQLWQQIIHTLMSLEADLFLELMGKFTHGVSTGIFLSKEQETLEKRIAIKRLAFCIFAAPPDYYFPKLPSIQEKLVEVLKQSPPLLQADAINCITVIVLRISSKYLGNFWPIILHELVVVINVDENSFRLFCPKLEE